MTPDRKLRELVRLMRAANDGDGAAFDALCERDESYRLLHIARWRAPLDADAAVRELLELRSPVSLELRYALARRLAGKIPLKAGRKPAGVARPARGVTSGAPVDAAACIRALLDFGTTSAPVEVSPAVRAAVVDLLLRRREAKRAPKLGPTNGARIRNMLAAHNARWHASQGESMREAIRLAAEESGAKAGTIQRILYPRK